MHNCTGDGQKLKSSLINQRTAAREHPCHRRSHKSSQSFSESRADLAATSCCARSSRTIQHCCMDVKRYMRATATAAEAPPPPRRRMTRRGLLALCLLAAGAAAFRRRRFQPNWSFRRSADWVIARTPTRYGDALRTIRKCMDCDALEVSLQNPCISCSPTPPCRSTTRKRSGSSAWRSSSRATRRL